MTKKSLNQNGKYVQELINYIEPEFIFSNKPLNRLKVIKNIKFILILLLLYQTPSNSKSNSFNHLDSKNLSKYFSGIVAFENKDNSAALEFFNSSKILLKKHDPY